MVTHWLNWNLSTHNVVVSNHASLCVGSCDSKNLFAVDQSLSNGHSIAEALPNTPLTVITFSKIVSLVSGGNDQTVVIEYQVGEGSEVVSIRFSDQEKADDSSVFVSFYMAILMFHKIRLLAYLLPVVCVLGTIAYCVHDKRTQIRKTLWVNKQSARKILSPMYRVLALFGLLAVLTSAAHAYLPDSYGPESLYLSAKNNSLKASMVADYLDRGARLNYTDDNARSALWWSIKHQAHNLSIALIANGANLTEHDGQLLNHAIQNQASSLVISAMLNKGVLDTAEALGGFDTKRHLKNSESTFAVAFRQYRSKR